MSRLVSSARGPQSLDPLSTRLVTSTQIDITKMAEDSWGVHFEGNKQLEDQLFALIQDKLRQIGGIDEDFLTSVIG